MKRFKPTKAHLAEFGRMVYEHLIHRDCWFGDEWSEDVMPMAKTAGLAEQASSDPKIHGSGLEDADPGDEVWVWKYAIYPRGEAWEAEK